MTTVTIYGDRSPADVLDMHLGGASGRCWLCGGEPVLCTKARKMLLAYFKHHPWDLLPFLREFAKQYATKPAFRHMAAEAVTAHFVDWAVRVQVEHMLEETVKRARLEAQRAANLATTGAQRAITQAADNIGSWRRKWRDLMDLRLTNGNGRPDRGVVRFGNVRDGGKVDPTPANTER